MANLLQSTAILKTWTFTATGHTIAVTISKAGGAFANPAAGAVNLTDNGDNTYSMQLAAADVGTLGQLTYKFVDTGTVIAPVSGDIDDEVVASLANAKDLITLSRAFQQLPSLTSTSDTLLATLITAASEAIEKYCRRRFYACSYDELYDGNGDRRLMLRAYPIQSVESVRYRPVTVLKIINSSTTVNQQARVKVTSTGLTLTRVASGVTTTNSLTYAGNVTLQAMATAITALANGWTAQVVGDSGGDYGLWPSADLWVPPSFGDGLSSQGALTTRGQYAELKLHTYELAGYQFDPRGWLLRAIPYTDPELLHPEDLVWPPGINNFRVQYTAGCTTIPEGVQEACALWVGVMYYETQRNPAIIMTSSAPAGGTATSTTYGTDIQSPPPHIASLLKPYRRYHV